jgi:hypothetical protein
VPKKKKGIRGIDFRVGKSVFQMLKEPSYIMSLLEPAAPSPDDVTLPRTVPCSFADDAQALLTDQMATLTVAPGGSACEARETVVRGCVG